jgi:3-hydroxyisobutyrate dehydrogenase
MVDSDTLPDHYNDIDKIYDEIWSRLRIGKKDRNSEFHQCYVASSGNEFPSVRTVVLRHVDKDLLTIGFHTDIRSSKINDIKTNSNVTVLLYDHAAKIQLKINGIAEINHKNANTKAIWSNIRDFSKKCYLVKNAPGTESNTPTSGYPEQYEDILPSPEELESGYQNFTHVNINIKAIEWLYLHQNGHRRAKFTISKTNIDKQWIAP